jgi:hypothetical protein
MKTSLIKAAAAAVAVFAIASVAQAGPIEGACLKSSRDAANRALCVCIQQVADITLLDNDQSLVASFFKDPNKAEKLRMSQTKRDDAFWERYTIFGDQARLSCTG